MTLNLNDEYVYELPEIRAISVFDSINYDYQDIELLSPGQRRYLVEHATKQGFKQISGKWMLHENGIKIYFPPHRLFNRNFKSFLPDVWEENVWMAVTPTQAAYLLLQKDAVDPEDIRQLMMKHPFNLKVLGVVLGHEKSYQDFLQAEPELQRLFERAQVLLKNKRPL